MKHTSLCYIENNGSYLMLCRNKKSNDENEGKWIGIGGKFNEGETPEECMRREVFEETGLELTSWKYRGIVTFSSDIYETEKMHLFTATSASSHISDCDEGTLMWVPKENLSSLNMWEGDKVFLELIANEDEPFFCLELTYEKDTLIKHTRVKPPHGFKMTNSSDTA